MSLRTNRPSGASVTPSPKALQTEAPPYQLNKLGSRSRLLLLACIAVLAFALRFHNVGSQSFSMDEAATAAIASMKWASFWKLVFTREMNMAAYYGILRALPFLQHSDALLRLASVIFGAG